MPCVLRVCACKASAAGSAAATHLQEERQQEDGALRAEDHARKPERPEQRSVTGVTCCAALQRRPTNVQTTLEREARMMRPATTSCRATTTGGTMQQVHRAVPLRQGARCNKYIVPCHCDRGHDATSASCRAVPLRQGARCNKYIVPCHYDRGYDATSTSCRAATTGGTVQQVAARCSAAQRTRTHPYPYISIE